MEAILALNSGMTKLGAPRRETADRINTAMQFANIRAETGPVAVIMVGGDADGMRDYAAAHNPGGHTLIAEGGSKDTIEGAHVTKVALLKPNNWRNIHVFTNDFHAPRTRWIFSKVLGYNYDLTMHPVCSGHLTVEELNFMKRREQVQLSVAKLKLIGIGPEDDAKREKRLPMFRFRGNDTPIARFLTRVDGMTNIKRG